MPAPEATLRLKNLYETTMAEWCHSYYIGQDPVSEAVRYALAGAGKRVRPVFCLLAAEAVGGKAEAALVPALALELVHTYSLVHDDLPVMDNDDLRRGRPTTHKVHGDAFALLAGDALLTDAMTLLADPGAAPPAQAPLPASQRIQLVQVLATAAGSRGMVLGQALDLHWTAKQGAAKDDLNAIHINKTGKLLGAACAMGAVAGGADQKTISIFNEFGIAIGLAFQIIDDLLDDSGTTGKSPGKDKQAEKLTYLSHWTPAEAASEAARLTSHAIFMLEQLSISHTNLTHYAQALVERNR